MTQQNVWNTWLRAKDNFLSQGEQAYPSYHQTLRHFADYYGFGFVPTVEAFVTLSPSNDYHGNLRSLASLLDGINKGIPCELITVSTFSSAKDRAYSFVTGERSFLDHTKGYKTTCFRDNILYLETSKRATVDGHMVGVWRGEKLTMKEANLILQRAGYRGLEQDFTSVARRAKVPITTLQATLWFYQKNLRAIKYSDQLDMLYDNGTKWVSVLHPRDFPPYRTKRLLHACA